MCCARCSPASSSGAFEDARDELRAAAAALAASAALRSDGTATTTSLVDDVDADVAGGGAAQLVLARADLRGVGLERGGRALDLVRVDGDGVLLADRVAALDGGVGRCVEVHDPGDGVEPGSAERRRVGCSGVVDGAARVGAGSGGTCLRVGEFGYAAS